MAALPLATRVLFGFNTEHVVAQQPSHCQQNHGHQGHADPNVPDISEHAMRLPSPDATPLICQCPG